MTVLFPRFDKPVIAGKFEISLQLIKYQQLKTIATTNNRNIKTSLNR